MTKNVKRSKRSQNRKVPRPVGNTVAKIERTVEKAIVSIAGGGTFSGAFQFALSDLPGYTDFNIYDQYRIKRIDVMFVPTMTVNTSYYNAADVEHGLPVIHTCSDYDDAVVPTLSEVLQHASCVTHGPFNKMITSTITPRVSTALYQGAFTGYGQLQDQWINTGSSGVQHFGLKYAVVGASGSSYNNMYIYAKFHLECKYPI